MSRLERLLSLLETGSSPSIRKAAAQQIGEIQKLYPYDLQALLEKVQVYLTSNDWDTRIAAGQAIDAISLNVPLWDPSKLDSNETTSTTTTSTTTTNSTDQQQQQQQQETFDLEFKNFDILKVVNNGAPLLGSGGQEFDDEEIDPNMDPKELLLKQKKRLKKRLGLDDFPVKLELENIVDDEDIIVNTKKKSSSSATTNTKQEKKEDIESVLDTTGMSARERNKAKRKARSTIKEKEESKQSTKRFKDVNGSTTSSTNNSNSNNNNNNNNSKSTKQHVTEQPQNSDKIVIESVLDVEKAYNQDEWPFTSIYNDLIIDLFSPLWQIRHGASVGLREICKRHGSGGGKTIHTPIDQLDYVNSKWLEDFSLRLLCVIALDRFGDYVSDQVVAPVRETCAQTLGVVVKYMNRDGVLKVLDILLQLQNNKQWEVRHGGLLGIKYLVSVRLDLIDDILPKILETITEGLMDHDDDVRATASETFHPISRQLVEKHVEKLPEILTILWDILLELDDLAVSTASVLNLLSNFYSYPEVLPDESNSNSNNGSSGGGQHHQNSASTSPPLPHSQHSKLAHLVPRLYPFFRHTLYSVRLSSIKTIERLIIATPTDAKTHWLLSILPDLMRYIFQNIIVEEKEDIIDISLHTWQCLVKLFKPNILRGACLAYLPQWVSLLATPPNIPIDNNLLLDSSKSNTTFPPPTNARKLKKTPLQQQQQQSQLQGIGNQEIYLNTKSKIIGCKAVGLLIRLWPLENNIEMQNIFHPMITRASGLHKHLAFLLLSEGYLSKKICPIPEYPAMFDIDPTIIDYIITHLDEKPDSVTTVNYYMEATSIVQNKLVADSRILASSLMNVGVDFSGIELLGLWTDTTRPLPYEQIMPFSVELVTNVYSVCLDYIKQTTAASGHDPALVQSIIDQLDSRKKTVLVTIGFVEKIQKEYHTQVTSAISELLIVSNKIPVKVTPVIRSLLHSIRNEENPLYQDRSSRSLSEFIDLCITRKPCPNDKVIRSMFSLLTDDRTDTPSVVNDVKVKTEKESLLLDQMDVADENPAPLVAADELKSLILGRKGSISFFHYLCRLFGPRLFNDLPTLQQIIFQGSMMTIYKKTLVEGSFDSALENLDQVQKVIEELQLLRTILPVLDHSFHPNMVEIIPVVFHFIKFPKHQVQMMTSRCISRFCQVLTLPTMHYLIRHLLPLLGDTKSLTNRMGAINTISQIIRDLELQLLPYIVFLTIPILGCMSDQDPDQRRVATMCFAKLVKLMPLEKGVDDPVGLDPELVQQKVNERKFLEQLLDGSKVENYPLPIRINTELRKYQQDGVNWLAFLNKYKLHGILCDDMGLGKTLQTICIIAGDDYHRHVNYVEKGTVDFQPLPSLVICPPSLVGHWFYEIKKFCDSSMRPMTYMGNPAERAAQRKMFKDHNVLIMSYDIMRNDIDILSTMHFNYCVLDEGHIIKNAKTKLTMAAKRLHSNHRLILPGTPIQNNVLELWSLFDFLMPGFLGTEKLFNEVYSKPILASKDPKCSQKDQESGVLAMEALHRQVLPFLLRRLKEDVLADLPPKIIQDRYCSLSPLQIRLYDYFSKTQLKQNISEDVKEEPELQKQQQEEEEKKSNNGGGATHIFQALQYLRKLCSHPSFVLNPQHPQYNTILKEFSLPPSEINDISHSPKLVSLKELLLECGIGTSNHQQQTLKSSTASANASINEISSTTNQHRVLIFAQMKQMLDIVENELFKKHLPSITYLRMDGATEAMKRHHIVNQFNSDPTIDVLLLTTHVGGLGLNLTGADTVIFLEHDWNPMKDLQAMDRAHRIGQKKVVNVYRLITSGTLEEKIMGLQKFKLNIANTVINQDNSSLQTMSTNELLNLFDYSSSESKGKGADDDYSNESSISMTGDVSTGSKSNAGGGKLKNILENLGELWDESQYTEEFNLSNFMSQLT